MNRPDDPTRPSRADQRRQAELDARYEVRDDDLLAALEKARGGITYETARWVMGAKQRERDELAQRRAAMGRDRKRRDIIREVIETKPREIDDIQYIHSVLALCGLPYKAPDAGQHHYFREYGRNTLALTAGALKHPETGKMVVPGLPYGPKARLLLLHLCSEALKQKSATIEIADSLSAFIRDMGFDVKGGERGTLTQFKEQLNRLASCTMQIGFWNGDGRADTLNATPIRRFSVWLPRDPDQKILWSSTITFDQEFYTSLTRHALPVDIRAVRAIAGSARKLDLLFWLGYRQRGITFPLRLTWDNLFQQFGGETAGIRKFRQNFREDVAAIVDIYPHAPIKLDEGGLTAYPRPPEEWLVPPKKKLIGAAERLKAKA